MLISSFLIAFAVAHARAETTFEDALDDAKCSDQVAHTLKEWEQNTAWKRKVDPSVGVTAFRSPTREIGVTLEARFYKNGAAEVIRVTPHTVLVNTFEAGDCVAQVKAIPVAKPRGPVFTDDDLKKLVSSNRDGIVYAWSPHMPLSLLAIPELRKAATKLGLELTLMLDPRADENFARKSAKKFKLDSSALKRLESVELLSRNMMIHYPSFAVYTKGKLLDRMSRGYKKAERYELALARQLKESK